MLFNSYIFIFLFLPLCLLGFYILENRQATLAKVWLTCFSLWFYGYFNFSYLLIMVSSIILNYGIHRLIIQARKNENTDRGKKISKTIMITGVTANLLLLFYFKYFDFFLENVNSIFGSSIPLKHILLPLGISFFTFQQISFVADSYRGELKEEGVSFVDYALFISFFPQLIAGPIVVHEEMLPQFARIGRDRRSREEKTEMFAKGIYVFVLGLAKKVLIADTFGVAVDMAYSNVGGLNRIESLMTILFYSLQLYFDFSGYCDMAKGIAGLFGMKIANNFNSPYKASNILEFWKRWHITLSRFLTKNVYIPLGGNRKGEGRMYVNYLLVFFLSGIWHGAGWNFVLWGMMHGVLYVITKWWMKQKERRDSSLNQNTDRSVSTVMKGKKCVVRALSCMFNFIYISIAWVYFRAASVDQANTLLGNILSGNSGLPGEAYADAFNLGEFWYVLKIIGIANLPYAKYYIMNIFTAVCLCITFFGKNVDELADKWKPKAIQAMITGVLFVWCVVSLSGVSTFLYFNF